MNSNIINIDQHFANLKVALAMGLQRGIFQDFETASAVKASIDAVEKFVKDHAHPASDVTPMTQEKTNNLQTQS